MTASSARDGLTIRIVLAAACPLVVVAGIVPIREHVDNTNIALVLVAVVLLMAVAGGRTAAIAASISSAASFDFFLTRPYNSFRITDSADVQTAALLVLIGLIGGELVERIRRSTARAASTETELATVLRQVELASGAESAGQLVTLAVHELTALLDLKSCRYVRGAAPLSMPELRHDSIRVPADVDPVAHGLVAIAVRANGRLQGHFVLAFPYDTVGVSLTVEQRHAAVALADAVGAGLVRLGNRSS